MLYPHFPNGITVAVVKSMSKGIPDIRRIILWRSSGECNCGRQHDNRNDSREEFFHDKPSLMVADNFKSEERDFFFRTNTGFALGDCDLFLYGIDALKVGQE